MKILNRPTLSFNEILLDSGAFVVEKDSMKWQNGIMVLEQGDDVTLGKTIPEILQDAFLYTNVTPLHRLPDGSIEFSFEHARMVA